MRDVEFRDEIDSSENMPQVNLRQLFSLAKDNKLNFIIIIILGIMNTFLTLIQPNLVAGIVNQANSKITSSIVFNIIELGVILLLSMFFTTFQYYLLQKISEVVVFNARKQLTGHLLRLPIFEYDKRKVGDLLSTISNDSSKLRLAYKAAIVLTSGSFIVIGASISMIIRDFSLFLLTFGTVGLSFIGVFVMSKFVQESSFHVQKELGSLTSIIERDLHAIRTIRSTNSISSEENRIYEKIQRLKELGIKLAKIHALVTPISNVSLQICGIVVIGVGGFRVSQGYMSIANLLAFILLLYTLIGPIGQILGSFSSIGDSLGAFARIKGLLEIPMESEYDIKFNENCMNQLSCTESVVSFKNVSFTYTKMKFGTNRLDKEEAMILKNVSFEVEKGDTVAIVGPSGAGKSTILQLIERFYDIDSGEIYINGKDCRRFSREDLRDLVTYVEQNAPMISGTLRENLTLGQENVSDKECLVDYCYFDHCTTTFFSLYFCSTNRKFRLRCNTRTISRTCSSHSTC